MFKEKEANLTFAAKQHKSSPSLTRIIILLLIMRGIPYFLTASCNFYSTTSFVFKTLHLKHQNSFPHQQTVCFHRNPPPDHWALISGLPTYVAESGYVSL